MMKLITQDVYLRTFAPIATVLPYSARLVCIERERER